MGTFRGWIVREADGVRASSLEDLDVALLEEQDFSGESAVLEVEYSSLNYKDALAVEGRPGVIRQLPLVAGIDAAGTLATGERVVVSGAGLGEEFHGGLSTLTRVPMEACVALPDGFSTELAAAVGTAGFTAALSVLALEAHGVSPVSGPVAVTGAVGGVGSIAVALLAARGFEVHAVTGRADSHAEYLRSLGAVEIVERAEVDAIRKPLSATRFAGAVDAVGGAVLSGVLASLRHSGVATTCGLAQSPSLATTVLPFILRGVTLAGIDSVRVTRERREAAWGLLFDTLDPATLEPVVQCVPLADIRACTGAMLEGQGAGRTVVNVRE